MNYVSLEKIILRNDHVCFFLFVCSFYFISLWSNMSAAMQFFSGPLASISIFFL